MLPVVFSDHAVEQMPDRGASKEQVARDLRGARYKLYDAVGIWLQSERYVDERTYKAIEGIARSYLDESLVPGYFGRARKFQQS